MILATVTLHHIMEFCFQHYNDEQYSTPSVVCLYRATKLLNLRIFDDPETGKPWDKSVADVGMEILCVSQVLYMHDKVRHSKTTK